MEYPIPPCYYRVSVKALIHNDTWRFLLVKEENWLWELPGGWVDYEENIRECLQREIEEEMWLETIFIAKEPSYFFTSTNLKWRNIANALYETKVKDYNFKPSEECIEIWFFTIEEASKLKTFPNIQEFLKHYNPKNHVHL
jgi:8-oxo-dGTP diphosphatase